jgi:4-hydroxythreonine-4-phosphate dehydrogenase
MTQPIALTLGDPAGVGGETALRAWMALRDETPFFLIGDLRRLNRLGGRLGLRACAIETPSEAAAAMAQGLPVLHHPLPEPDAPLGVPAAANAPAVIEIIERGVALARSGAAIGLCTGPINKRALQQGAGFAFPGHTEFLASLAGAERAVMMLVSPMLRVVPVTIHIPLRAAPDALTAELLEHTLRVTHLALTEDFGLADPRVAVAGLNPHAGEGGSMGLDEIALIAPVLARLRAEGVRISGPLPADTMFHAEARARYDVAVCMYHDQALIPIKTLDFAGGVNVTLGLDFVRTSPDHGTAYDIAPDLRADPTSLIAALRLARRLGETRAARTK